MNYDKLSKSQLISEIEELNRQVQELKFKTRDESMLLTLLNSLPDNILMVDKNLRITWANSTSLEKSPDAVGNYCYEVYQKSKSMCEGCPCAKAIESKKVEKDVVSLKDQNGETCYWEIFGIPIMDQLGEISGVVEVSRDVTDKIVSEKKLKENTTALQHAKEEAEVANKAKSNFLANTSHEIRTPMNGIMGMVQLLKTTKLTGNQKEYIDILDESTKRLSEIINNILEISKIEEGKLELSKGVISIKAIVEDIYSFYSIQAKNNKLNFTFEIEPNVPDKLIGDAYRLNQMLINIVDNSIKFTKEGYIKLKLTELTRTKRYTNLRVVVEDTGIGVPEEKLEYIFERFNQVDSSLTREYGGTGLGLAISKQLVEMMDGNITIKSKVDEGTTILIDFKLEYLQSSNSPEEKEVKTSKAKSKEKKRILIVEDEIVGRVTLKLMLRDKYDIVFAKNGKEGVEMYKLYSPDLVLMDIMMPVMNGFEAFDEIERQDPDRVPIIACTAKVIDTEKKYLVSYGFDDYLSKPIDMKILNEILDKYLLD